MKHGLGVGIGVVIGLAVVVGLVLLVRWWIQQDPNREQAVAEFVERAFAGSFVRYGLIGTMGSITAAGFLLFLFLSIFSQYVPWSSLLLTPFVGVGFTIVLWCMGFGTFHVGSDEIAVFNTAWGTEVYYTQQGRQFYIPLFMNEQQPGH